MCIRDSASVVKGGAVGLAKVLKEEFGVWSAPRYIQKPAFMCEVFRDKKTFGNSQFPFTEARPEALDYSKENFPGTYAGLEHILVLPWNEGYTSEHVAFIADAIQKSVKELGV